MKTQMSTGLAKLQGVAKLSAVVWMWPWLRRLNVCTYLSPGWKYVFWREISYYFNTPIGYVFLVVALFLNFVFFFLGFFGIAQAYFSERAASVQGYLTMLPVTFILLVPAITMRLWAEECKSGTIEALRTLPITDFSLCFAKFLAASLIVSSVVFAILPMAIFTWLIGDGFDWGQTFAMLFGSTLMVGAYVSSGMVLSALAKEQITAFIFIFLMSVFMFFSNFFIINQHLPDWLADFIGFFSFSFHYLNFSLGAITLADTVYYVSFILLMLLLNVYQLKRMQ